MERDGDLLPADPGLFPVPGGVCRPAESEGTQPASGRWRIGIDTGGTFTDLVAVDANGSLRLIKVSSTPWEPSIACFEALSRAGTEVSGDIDSFVLGTTIATNALLQRKGRTTLFLTTAGFEDTLYIQRIDRRGLYDLQWVKPTPFVARRHCLGVRERVLSDGSVAVPLTEAEIDRVVEQVRAIQAELGEVAVAISLLFSYLNDAHEALLASHLRRALPDVPISVSSEVAPIWREFERGNTTSMDAYVKPIVGEFVTSLNAGLDERGIHGWRALMKSNGGQVALGRAAERPVEIVLSGPAAGMIAGNFFARAVRSDKAVTLDMGGTSADVGVVVDGELKFSGLFEIEWGLPISLPIIDVTTIGAGGSSIASIDYGGLLRVGPESAGADPGPACYGKGGSRPTITDANLVIGRLDPDFFLGGEIRLDVERATAAIDTLTAPLEMRREDVAEAIISVAVENMAGAVRLVTVDRGFDYRAFDLIAFGGAGPLHAAEIARRMGMRRVLVPPSPGLVSALGAVIADERIDRRATLVRRLDTPEAADLPAELARLAQATARELAEHRQAGFKLRGQHPDREGAHLGILASTYVACRYIGQNYEQEIRMEYGHVDKSFELAIPIAPTAQDFLTQLADRFHAAHERAYGYAMPDQPIHSVYLGASAFVRSEPPTVKPYPGRSLTPRLAVLSGHPGGTRDSVRPAEAAPPGGQAEPRFGTGLPASTTRRVLAGAGRWIEARIVHRDDLDAGSTLAGPAIIEERDSTTYVPPDFQATVDQTQCLILSMVS
jgi:N-methylhydantoinase A